MRERGSVKSDSWLSLPEEVTGDVELLGTNNDNFVALKRCFGNYRGQAAEKMATAVYQYWLWIKRRKSVKHESKMLFRVI